MMICFEALIERGGSQFVEIAKLSFKERHCAGNLVTGAISGELQGWAQISNARS
jgi:hypothetical protein